MSADLSLQHQPVGNLFPWPITSADRDQYALSAEEIAFFQENGYVKGGKVLDDAQINQLRAELQTFFNPDHPGHELWYEYHTNESASADTVLFHALGAWRITPGLHDILWHPGVTVRASQLLGGSVRFWHDQLFCKPAKHGGVVAWHQDYSYWTRTKPMAHITCWIGLDDTILENGCVHFVPGSHKWDLLPITGLAGDMDAIREVLNDEQWHQLNNPVPMELKKGECSFHHSLTIHGSFANKSDRPRRGVVLNLVRDGVCSDSNEALLAGVPPIPKGQPLQGQFFPMLYEI